LFHKLCKQNEANKILIVAHKLRNVVQHLDCVKEISQTLNITFG